MKTDKVSSGINHRTLVSSLALLSGVSGIMLPSSVLTQGDPLPSWNEGADKQAILDFVRITTEKGSAKFVPPMIVSPLSIKTVHCGSSTPCSRS
jgi:hypothetical protein